MQRFSRTKLLVGESSFSQLAETHIAIIGLGAVGGYAVEGLARAGVGRLTIVDFDVIQPSNINRQIFALESTLGQPKTRAARERILQINPSCRITPARLFADQDSIQQILDAKPDIVIDAIDSLNPKIQVLTASVRSGITTFSSMGAALRTDPSLVKIDDIARTRDCPLARRVRKRLRSHNIEKGITCVYSTEKVCFEYRSPQQKKGTEPHGTRGRDRRTLGSLPTITGIFGLMLANEAIMTIVNKP